MNNMQFNFHISRKAPVERVLFFGRDLTMLWASANIYRTRGRKVWAWKITGEDVPSQCRVACSRAKLKRQETKNKKKS
jgi:hypothetical protein